MTIKHIIATTALAAILAACGGGTKIDATDGITLDGTFKEAIEPLGESDKLKAAAGLLMISYENSPRYTEADLDYVREAKEEASYMLPGSDAPMFESRGRVFEEIAQEAGSALNGLSVQDLIDHYNLTTGQYDEYLKDKEEAEAREQAEAEAEQAEVEAEAARKVAASAASALAARRKSIAEARGTLATDLKDVERKLADARERLEAAESEVAKARDRQKAMATFGEFETGFGRSSYGTGNISITVVNSTDGAISNPKVMMDAVSSSKSLATRNPARIYRSERRSEVVAAGGEKTFEFYTSFEGDNAVKEAMKDSLGSWSVTPRLVSYEDANGETISLLSPEAAREVVASLPGTITACEAAVARADTARSDYDRLGKLDDDAVMDAKLPAAISC